MHPASAQTTYALLHHFQDGTAGDGIIFEVTPAGVETVLHNFGDGSTTNDGNSPGPLVLASNGNVYGLTSLGGSASEGTVFELSTSGQYTILHHFGDGSVVNDGEQPIGLIQGSDGNFYGTTSLGGGSTPNGGTAFKITPSGVVKILYSFSLTTGGLNTQPQSGLIQASDGNFYGTTSYTLFRLTSAGSLTVLHTFGTALSGDGYSPIGSLVQGTDNALYGSTSWGGSALSLQDGGGVAFKETIYAAPLVVNVATATPNPVTGTKTNLSVLGSDNDGAASLTYTWATTGTAPAPVTFSVNGTNAAQNSTATFTKAGTYNLQATITDSAGLSTTALVTVLVNQTATTISVSPSSSSIVAGGAQQYSATAYDQFGSTLTTQPIFTYSVSGGGTISASGLLTTTTVGGPYTVTASAGAARGTASVSVLAPAVPAPSGLRVVPSSNRTVLYWNAVSGATGYNVYRSTTKGGEGSVPSTANASVGTNGPLGVYHTDTGLAPNTTYYYQVTAVIGSSESAKSNEAASSTGGTLLGKPTGLTATAGANGIVLRWTTVAGAVSYDLFRNVAGKSSMLYQVGLTGNVWTDAGVTSGVAYTYFLTAVNNDGEGPASNSATAH